MRKNLLISSTMIVFSLVYISGCKKESVSHIQCDTTGWIPDSIRYSNAVAPLLTLYCTGCHNSSSHPKGVNLAGYDNVKKYVDNDMLLGTIGHLKNYKPMPKNGAQLKQEEICKIKFWIDNAALNN